MKGIIASLFLAGSVAFAQTLPASKQYKVTLSWTAPVPNPNDPNPLNGYNIYRSGAGIGYRVINTGLILNTNFTDTTVDNSTTYQYYATAVDTQGNESDPSNTITVNVPFVPFPPTLETLTAK